MIWRYHSIAAQAAASGLAVRGAFHPRPEDGVPLLPDGAAAGTLVLLGFVPGLGWDDFAASAEAADGMDEALDRWSARVTGQLAARLGAAALFPWGGPPYLPFQRWAQRAETVFASPLGILLHPDWGLWHSYRGALALRERIGLPARAAQHSPCESCQTKPCLSACPAGAFVPGHYDVAACAAHVDGPDSGACLPKGCAARRACPVGAQWHYGEAQARFHMSRFLAALR